MPTGSMAEWFARFVAICDSGWIVVRGAERTLDWLFYKKDNIKYSIKAWLGGQGLRAILIFRRGRRDVGYARCNGEEWMGTDLVARRS